MKRAAIALGLVLIFGAARLPLEVHLTKLQREAGFRTVSLDLPLREQVGQMGFVAALSGFRSLVAAVLWIEAHNAWQDLEWGRMAGIFQTVTSLQPRSILYWDLSAWHMAWNASVAALENPEQPSRILRERAQRQYWELGRKFYEDGLRANPDSADLWEKLAILERDKFEDHAASARAFLTAAEKPGARPYFSRMAGYELAKVSGREREAYDVLKAAYDRGDRQATLLRVLRELEEKLGVPADQRIKGSP